MNFDKFLEQHEDLYSDWVDAMETANRYKKTYEDHMESIDFNAVSKLSYEEIQLFYESINVYGANYKLKEKIKELIEEAKKRAFPEYAKAHYFPMLNNMKTLEVDEIKSLDIFLYERSYPLTRDYLVNGYLNGVPCNKKDKMFGELVEMKVVVKMIAPTCPYCRRHMMYESIPSEHVKQLKNDFSYAFCEYEEGYFYCDSCDREVDFNRDKGLIKKFIDLLGTHYDYSLIVEPDLTYANK